MPYPVIQDGTQPFGIADSPVMIDGVSYIAEEMSSAGPSTVVEIKDDKGRPIGQAIIPENFTMSGRLQLATAATPIPQRGSTFVLDGATWYVTESGKTRTQGAYNIVPFSARMRIAT